MQAVSKQCSPANVRALLTDLKACTSAKNLERGKQIHKKTVENGTISYVNVASSLINMYAKCGSMAEARRVFDSITKPSLVSWNTIILGYADNGEGETALGLFTRMKSQGYAPDSITFMATVKACSCFAFNPDGSRRAECLERGRQIHSEIGCHINLYVQNSLIDMYAKCKNMTAARQVFDGIKLPNVVSWNALLLGYADNGEGRTTLDLFQIMKSQGCAPDSITFIAAFKACSSLATRGDESGKAACRELGKQLHAEAGPHLNTFVRNTMIDMYSKCGSMALARQVFDSIKHRDKVSWNVLILGYAENGDGGTALDLYAKMRSNGFVPDSVTFVATLKACTALALTLGRSGKTECLELGKQLHSDVGSCLNLMVQNTLIDMYANCGSIVDAQQVFDGIKQPDLVSWNALISGYAESGEASIALNLYKRMRYQGFKPDFITSVAALKACGSLGSLESGRKVHMEIDVGKEQTSIMITCLVDFYSKCGNMEEAQNIFDSHPGRRDSRTWTALLAGYSRLGDSNAVFESFDRMQNDNVQPNDVTFLCVLTCCSHAGLVEKAKEYFAKMLSGYNMVPRLEHYACMIDILSRSNKLDDALGLLQSMPCRSNAVIWKTLLSGCRKWKNIGVGRMAFQSLVSLDDTIPPAYVLMSHVFKTKEQQEIVLGKQSKEPAQSCWSNEFGEIHVFFAHS